MFFENTIDNKQIIKTEDGYDILDLGSSIFKQDNIFKGVSIKLQKVGKDMDMRPDIITRAVYGDEEYTELMMKYNNIQNPFSVQEGDVIVLPPSMDIQTNVATPISIQRESDDALIRQYHKYVDKDKKPDTDGSQTNKLSVPKSTDETQVNMDVTAAGSPSTQKLREANLANLGAKAIKELNGRLYFGADTDVKCATDGITTTEYLNTVIKNSIGKTE